MSNGAQTLGIGRIVHVNIGTKETPILRPAQVVRVWTDEMCNVQMATDGTNDAESLAVIHVIPSAFEKTVPSHVWLTSLHQGEGPREWRWPARG
jgi:hypothetical protein